MRTRDPHLGKVVFFVRIVLAGLPKCGSVQQVSSSSKQSVAVVERSTIRPTASLLNGTHDRPQGLPASYSISRCNRLPWRQQSGNRRKRGLGGH